MKLLHVYGDDDYPVLTLQDSEYHKLSYLELYNLAIEKDTEGFGVFEFEEGYYIEAYEFEGVTLTDEFINFLNNKKDYDSTKHNDWFIVEKE